MQLIPFTMPMAHIWLAVDITVAVAALPCAPPAACAVRVANNALLQLTQNNQYCQNRHSSQPCM